MAKKTTSPSAKAQYARYAKEEHWKKNRIIKLERHLKSNPDDMIAIDALAKVKNMTEPRRANTVNEHVAKPSDRLNAQLDKLAK